MANKENEKEIKKEKSNRLDKFRSLINKKAGFEASFSLEEPNPTDVKKWITTGSRWLDRIVCAGKVAGIPMGKIVEVAGTPSTGKSYMAMQIGANAVKEGIDVVYFDSESALDSNFIRKIGLNPDSFLYVQASSVEFVLGTIEQLLAENSNPMMFIWDSLAQTPTEKDVESDFDPQSQIAMKARVLSRGFQKLTVPIANHGSTLLIVNQLKTNIGDQFNPWFTPGGKSPAYSYSLRIWLTISNTKKNRIEDEAGNQVGSLVTAKIEKSRFGCLNRAAQFRIMWGGKEEVAIQDQESWLEIIKSSKYFEASGAWFTLKYPDGTEEKFQTAGWLEKLQNEKFREHVLAIIDEVLLK